MAKYKLTQKTNTDGTTQDIQLDASCVDLSGYVPTSRTINSKALSSNITLAASDVKALPNYSLSISTGSGNPREVRFVRVNYTTFDGNNAAYFRIGAMCSHGNGSSYTFLEDIIIGVSAAPSVTCTIYKQVQNTSTFTVDSHTVHFGDVYWVVDTTNKYVDFYIIGGQYATINFTPFMRIGNTISDTSKIVQYTSANYYSSGTRVWDATGNGSLYARTSDISGKQDTLVSGTNIKTINNNSILGSGNISISADTSNCLKIDGSNTMTGVLNLKASGNNETNIGTNGIRWGTDSLPQDTSPQYICTIDAFASGGRQKWASVSDLRSQLNIPSAVTSVNGLSGGTISSETTISGNLNAQYVKGTWLYTSAATDLSSWTDVFVNSGGWLYKRAKASFISDLGIPDMSKYKVKQTYVMSNNSNSPVAILGMVSETAWYILYPNTYAGYICGYANDGTTIRLKCNSPLVFRCSSTTGNITFYGIAASGSVATSVYKLSSFQLYKIEFDT